MSISLARTENDNEEKALQVKVKASKALAARNDLIDTERNLDQVLPSQ